MKGEDRCARRGGGKVSQTLLTQSLQATALAAPEKLVLGGSQASGSSLCTKIWEQCGKDAAQGTTYMVQPNSPVLFP